MGARLGGPDCIALHGGAWAWDQHGDEHGHGHGMAISIQDDGHAWASTYLGSLVTQGMGQVVIVALDSGLL